MLRRAIQITHTRKSSSKFPCIQKLMLLYENLNLHTANPTQEHFDNLG